LKPFGALLDLKFDKLAFVQRLVPVHLNGGEMNEDVLSRLALNKSVPLRGIEPLDHTLFASQRFHSSASDVPIQVLGTPVGSSEGPDRSRTPIPKGLQDRISGGILAQPEIGVQTAAQEERK
jgi:hypothetical protein